MENIQLIKETFSRTRFISNRDNITIFDYCINNIQGNANNLIEMKAVREQLIRGRKLMSRDLVILYNYLLSEDGISTFNIQRLELYKKNAIKGFISIIQTIDTLNYLIDEGDSEIIHNTYVQGVIDAATIAGDTIPNLVTLLGLDGLLDEIDPHIPSLEMVKVGRLWDAACLQFSRYNILNPLLNKSTFPAGDPIYGLRGWSSNGTTYINDNITMKRRADIPSNCSSIVVCDAYNNASIDQAACGSVSGNYYIMRPYLSGGGIYYMTTTTAIAPLLTTHNVFMALSTHGASGTRARLKQNASYANFSGNIVNTEMTNARDVFTCAYNNDGTPLRWYTQGNVQFRCEGQELSDVILDAIEVAWNNYVTVTSQPVWVAGETITSDGKEVWLWGGDSKSGTSSAVGKYALPNTVFQRRRSNGLLEEVKGIDLYDVPSTGSPCPLFGRLYNEREESRGKRIVFGFYGIGGSAFLNDFKSASWDITDSGTVYPAAKVVWDATLVLAGVTKPAGIVLFIGINDMNEAANIANTQIQMDNFFNQLNIDYGSPLIYVSLPSLQTLPSEPALTRLNTIRAKLASIASLNSNIIIFEDEATQVFNNPANTTDGTHFNYAGNEVVAQNLINALV